eukprot:4218346-Prymnesium_polylepis.1
MATLPNMAWAPPSYGMHAPAPRARSPSAAPRGRWTISPRPHAPRRTVSRRPHAQQQRAPPPRTPPAPEASRPPNRLDVQRRCSAPALPPPSALAVALTWRRQSRRRLAATPHHWCSRQPCASGQRAPSSLQ